MLLTFGLLLTFILGYFIIQTTAPLLSNLEKIGLSFIIGIGVQTILMIILDLFGIPLTVTSISLFSFIVLGTCVCLSYRHFTNNRSDFFNYTWKDLNINRYTLLWLVVLGIIVYTEYYNFQKCIYFPTFDRDSITSFDFMGRVIANEHCMANSTFFIGTDLYPIGTASATTYTPFVHLSYAYVYLFGAETSKVINALSYLTFLVSFYAILVRRINPTMAILATLFTLLVPEFIAFSSMSATNALHAVYAALAILYAWFYFESNDKQAYWLCIILTILNIWTRQEGLVFMAGIGFVMFVKMLRNRQYKDFLIYALSCSSIYIFWLVYMKVKLVVAPADSFNLLPIWDLEKANTVYSSFKGLLINKQFFGLTFILAAFALICSVYWIYKDRKYELPLMFIVSLVMYMFLIYQVEYKWDSITNVLNYSCKRFLFCFAPIAWAFIFVNPLSKRLSDFIDKLQGHQSV